MNTMALFTWFLCQIPGVVLLDLAEATPQECWLLRTTTQTAGYAQSFWPGLLPACYGGFTLRTRHIGTGCKAGRLLTLLSNRHVRRYFPSWESSLTAPSHSSCAQFGTVWGGCQHYRCKCNSPYPYVLDTETGLQWNCASHGVDGSNPVREYYGADCYRLLWRVLFPPPGSL